jgi:HlyD family secretion protein
LDQLLADARPEEVAATQANLDAAQAAVWNASAQRDQLQRGPTEAEIAAARSQVASAQAQLKVASDTHDQTMRFQTVTVPGGGKQEICPGLGMPEEQARYNLRAANESLAAAQTQLDQLLAGPTQEQLDAANANVAAAVAQRDAAQAQLDLLLAGASVHQVEAAQASVEQAKVALEMAQAELAKTRLVAPFDGVVTTVNVHEEEIAPPSLPAFVLVDMSELQIVVDVDEIDVARITEGQAVDITVDALPDETIPGHVDQVAPAASQMGGVVVYQVTIVLDEIDLPLRVGMTATADITVERLEDVVLVPNWAIRIDREAGQTLVNVLRENSVQEVPVELGLRGRDVSQVLSGLEEGDEIAAGEVESLRSLFAQEEE